MDRRSFERFRVERTQIVVRRDDLRHVRLVDFAGRKQISSFGEKRTSQGRENDEEFTASEIEVEPSVSLAVPRWTLRSTPLRSCEGRRERTPFHFRRFSPFPRRFPLRHRTIRFGATKCRCAVRF